MKSRDIPSRSLIQLSTLLIGDRRVLSPLCSSDLNGGTRELGSDSLIYSGLVCYLSGLVKLVDGRDIPESDCFPVPEIAACELIDCSAWSMMLFDILVIVDGIGDSSQVA